MSVGTWTSPTPPRRRETDRAPDTRIGGAVSGRTGPAGRGGTSAMNAAGSTFNTGSRSERRSSTQDSDVRLSTGEGLRAPTVPAGTAAAARLPLKILVQMTKQLSVLLRAGSGVVPALSAIQRQMKRPAHAALLGVLISDLEDGSTLTAALRRHPRIFDAVYCAIVAAGEASGSLTEMLERLAGIVGKRRILRKKIIGALAYPTLLVCMCANIMLVLLFFVLPRFADMFVQLGVETPSVTRVMLAVAGLLRGYWPAILAGVGAVIGLGVWAALHDAGRQWASNMQLSIPVIGGLRTKLIQAQIFRTMGMLLESGVGVLETLELVRESTRNRRFQQLFGNLEQVVTSGGRLSSAFEGSGLVEPSFCQAIYTGEDTGNLGGTLTFCADVLDESNEELITMVMRLIEPLILIGMGVVVGAVAIALFLPLFDMTSAIK